MKRKVIVLGSLVGLAMLASGCPQANQAAYSLTVSPSSSSVVAGNSATYTVSVSAPKQSAGKGTATFSASGLPAGATATFSPATLSSPGNVQMTVIVPASAAAGNYSVTVTGTIAGQGSRSATATLSVSASVPPPPPPLVLVLPAVLTSPAGQAYSGTFTATGGVPPYTFAVASGALPAGMTLSSTGVLSGTPTTVGSYTFEVSVTDNAGAVMSVRIASPVSSKGGAQ